MAEEFSERGEDKEAQAKKTQEALLRFYALSPEEQRKIASERFRELAFKGLGHRKYGPRKK